MGLKGKTPKDVQLLKVPGPSPRRRSVAEMRADLEAKGSAAVKDLFEGNYEERRKFGVVDIFDTLGFAVSNCSWHDYKKVTSCSFVTMHLL